MKLTLTSYTTGADYNFINLKALNWTIDWILSLKIEYENCLFFQFQAKFINEAVINITTDILFHCHIVPFKTG